MNNEIIIEAEENEAAVIYSNDIISLAMDAEKRIEAVNKIKMIALRVTNAHDWTDQGGKPYLQVSGSEKIARVFGVSWRIDEPTFEKEESGHYSYTYKGYFNVKGAEVEAIGTRGSKDPFFSMKKGGTKPISEIDKGDVKKAAYTNCIGNGITRLLGLRNLSWDDLKIASIKKEDVGKITYNNDTPEMSEDAKNHKIRIEEMLSEMCEGDAVKTQACLLKITSFKGADGKTIVGKTSVDDLSEKAVTVTYGKVKAEYEKWLEKQEK